MADLWGGTPFVGRVLELGELRASLEAAGAGRGAALLVAGEPGIGKTRLLLELARVANDQGARVLVGRAYESEGVPPYLPFTEALRDYALSEPTDRLRLQLGDGAPDVALLVRELRARFPDLPSGASLGAEQDRYRLFESVAEFVLSIAGLSPRGALLCVDDLHWADKPTLLLFQHLARKVSRAPLVLVGTYRPVELGHAHPLSDVLAELSREHLYRRFLLPSLSAADVEMLIGALNGSAVAPAVAEAIYRGTEGNPFFVKEVVRQLASEGKDLTDPTASVIEWSIPEGVRQVIARRLSRLSPDANRLLQVAAVLGEGFTFELLSAVDSPGAERPRPR